MKSVKLLMGGLVALLLACGLPLSAAAEGQPDIFGRYAVSIDAHTGDILYNKEAQHQAFPASITKVLTGIVAMEHMKPTDVITFSQQALNEEKSNYQAEFHVGETMDRDTALMTLMVLSANDVAYAIAEKVAGSPEAFAKLMNEKAAELGAKNSHFVRPNGLHDPNHYTTPYDMALITRGALQHPTLMRAMSTKRTSITTSQQTLSIFNKASFFENPECVGGKTGYTSQARNTLVEINKRGDAQIINVVMMSQRPEIYNDMNIISAYSFPQLVKQQVLDQNVWTHTFSFLNQSVPAGLDRSVALMLKQGEEKHVKSVLRPRQLADQKLYNEGVWQGEVLGQVDIVKNGIVLDTVNVVAKESMSFPKPAEKPAAKKTELLSASALLLAGVAAGGVGLVYRAARKVKGTA